MKELNLPSGMTAVFRQGKGRDLLNAQRKAKTLKKSFSLLSPNLRKLKDKPSFMRMCWI